MDKDDVAYDTPTVSKFRQLKDLMWVRECLEDLTAAEFALSVEQQSDPSAIASARSAVNGNANLGLSSTSSAPPRKKKRAVDYEKILTQLTKRIEDITCEPFTEMVEEDIVQDDKKGLAKKSVSLAVEKEHTVPVLNPSRGMGRYAYSTEQRVTLLE